MCSLQTCWLYSFQTSPLGDSQLPFYVKMRDTWIIILSNILLIQFFIVSEDYVQIMNLKIYCFLLC